MPPKAAPEQNLALARAVQTGNITAVRAVIADALKKAHGDEINDGDGGAELRALLIAKEEGKTWSSALRAAIEQSDLIFVKTILRATKNFDETIRERILEDMFADGSALTYAALKGNFAAFEHLFILFTGDMGRKDNDLPFLLFCILRYLPSYSSSGLLTNPKDTARCAYMLADHADYDGTALNKSVAEYTCRQLASNNMSEVLQAYVGGLLTTKDAANKSVPAMLAEGNNGALGIAFAHIANIKPFPIEYFVDLLKNAQAEYLPGMRKLLQNIIEPQFIQLIAMKLGRELHKNAFRIELDNTSLGEDRKDDSYGAKRYAEALVRGQKSIEQSRQLNDSIDAFQSIKSLESPEFASLLFETRGRRIHKEFASVVKEEMRICRQSLGKVNVFEKAKNKVALFEMLAAMDFDNGLQDNETPQTKFLKVCLAELESKKINLPEDSPHLYAFLFATAAAEGKVLTISGNKVIGMQGIEAAAEQRAANTTTAAATSKAVTYAATTRRYAQLPDEEFDFAWLSNPTGQSTQANNNLAAAASATTPAYSQKKARQSSVGEPWGSVEAKLNDKVEDIIENTKAAGMLTPESEQALRQKFTAIVAELKVLHGNNNRIDLDNFVSEQELIRWLEVITSTSATAHQLRR